MIITTMAHILTSLMLATQTTEMKKKIPEIDGLL